jgi:copper chaperone CopZ
MKSIKYLAISALLFLMMTSCENAAEPKAQVDNNAVVKIVIGVEGMTCGGCESTVNSSLQKLNGVVSSTASFENKLVQVEADTNLVSVEQMKKAIKDVGYYIINE